MHSSGMRTARLLTVSQHALRKGGVSQHALGRGVCIPACTGPGGVCISTCTGQGGVCWGVSAQGGVCLWSQVVYPSMQWGRHAPCRQTKHNLHKLRLRAVTRMHSSRMCTARFNGHLHGMGVCGVCLEGVHPLDPEADTPCDQND